MIITRYCAYNEILDKNGTRCKQCPLFLWPDSESSTKCLPIPLTHLSWNSATTISVCTLCSVGLALCIFTLVFSIRKRQSKLMKATCPKLSMITLCGVGVAYPTCMLLVVPPTETVCRISVIGVHLSFCMTYASLLIVSRNHGYCSRYYILYANHNAIL